MFFPPTSWDKGQTSSEDLSKIRRLLTVWHACKEEPKNTENTVLSENRHAGLKGLKS